jgi:hypothetical protein
MEMGGRGSGTYSGERPMQGSVERRIKVTCWIFSIALFLVKYQNILEAGSASVIR